VFRSGDWAEGLEGSFDLVVSNPPYIPSAEIDALMPEVSRYEPRLALDGGADGLDAYRVIARGMAGVLLPDAHLLVEVGDGQSDSVAAVFAAAGLACTARRSDLEGRTRCLTLQWNR
jgi:release factor glutamine methyltransferase